MAIIIIVEDGTGKVDANSYASEAAGDAYVETMIQGGTPWTGATADEKKAGLVSATRYIDGNMIYIGFRKTEEQALQWPRIVAVDPDHHDSVDNPYRISSGYDPLVGAPALGLFLEPVDILPDDALPQTLIDATIEMAVAMIEKDRLARTPQAEGIKSMGIGRGAIKFVFDPDDRMKIFPISVTTLLDRLGAVRELIGGSGSSRLMR